MASDAAVSMDGQAREKQSKRRNRKQRSRKEGRSRVGEVNALGYSMGEGVLELVRRPAIKFPQGGNVDRTVKAKVVMERAENFGLRLKFDSGLIVVEQAATADPEICAVMVEELGRYLGEIRSHLERCAIATRAKGLRGQRIWFPECGEGRLTDVQGDGQLIALVKQDESRSPLNVSVQAEDILILLVEASSSPDDKPRSEKPRKSILQLLRGSKAT
jgi:hypothetical protein